MNRTVLVGVLVVIGVLVDLWTGYSPFPGYAALLGLVGCAGIIIVSKWLGTIWLQKPEDHYPDDVPPDVQEDLRG
jgi:hypothetical protein